MSKFSIFLDKMGLEDNLKGAVLEACKVILEEVASTASVGVPSPAGAFNPSIHNAHPKVQQMQKEYNDFLQETNKKRLGKFKSFLENMGLKPTLSVSLHEAFETILEYMELSWNASDPTMSAGFGSLGSNQPMFTPTVPASGGTDFDVNRNPGTSGFGVVPQTSLETKPKDAYRFPKAVLNSGKDIKKLMGVANDKIPQVEKMNASPTPFFHYMNFFNSQNFF